MAIKSSSYIDDPTYVIQVPVVERDDITQEAELLRLRGIRPNKKLIQAKLGVYEAIIYSGDLGLKAQSMPWSASSTPDPRVITQLLDWGNSQSEKIGTLIKNFVESPTDEMLNYVLKELEKAKLLHKEEKTSSQVIQYNGTLAKCLENYLEHSPSGVGISDLYAFARSVHKSRRVESAVRQWVRRSLRDGKIHLDGDKYKKI